jgi:hypothetical protein
MAAMLTAKLPRVDRFKGLNNVSDPMRLGLGWLATAENINITDTGAMEGRDGYSLAMAGSFTGAYSTLDYARMYLVDGGVLKAMAGPSTAHALRPGLASAPMHWAEVNDNVYFNNGTDSGIIWPDNTIQEWRWPQPSAPAVAAVTGDLPVGLYRVCCTFLNQNGRETGAGDIAEIDISAGQALQISGIPQAAEHTTCVYIAPANSTVFQFAANPSNTAMVWNDSPDALGVDLRANDFYPLPTGCGVIQHWRGRMYAAQYLPTENQTVIWFSQPLGYHLFKLESDFIMVPGRVRMLAPTQTGLVIGTDKRIHAYDGTSLVQLAEYGVPPGQHWCADDNEAVKFWTNRGVASALPFSNLTERAVSLAHGNQAGAAIVRSGGQKRFLVSLQQGGNAFNPHS